MQSPSVRPTLTGWAGWPMSGSISRTRRRGRI